MVDIHQSAWRGGVDRLRRHAVWGVFVFLAALFVPEIVREFAVRDYGKATPPATVDRLLDTVTPGLASVVTLLVLAALFFVFVVPLAQRDEARAEVERLKEERPVFDIDLVPDEPGVSAAHLFPGPTPPPEPVGQAFVRFVNNGSTGRFAFQIDEIPGCPSFELPWRLPTNIDWNDAPEVAAGTSGIVNLGHMQIEGATVGPLMQPQPPGSYSFYDHRAIGADRRFFQVSGVKTDAMGHPTRESLLDPDTHLDIVVRVTQLWSGDLAHFRIRLGFREGDDRIAYLPAVAVERLREPANN